MLAYVILPDHFHLLIQPNDKSNFSQIMHSLKSRFTRAFKKKKNITDHLNLWQRRFWEHQLRDEHDLQMHVDYIHFNPVKHGLTERPDQWPWSTYHRYIETGRYAKKSLVDLQDNFDNILVGE